MPDAPTPAPLSLRRHLQKARLDAAVTSVSSGLLLGFVLIAGAVTYVAGQRGLLLPSAWKIALGAGLVVFLIKVAMDLLLPAPDLGRLRQVLAQAFGTGMADDGEVSRQARTVIEFRARLAEAEARASTSTRRRLTAVLLKLDDWLDAIVQIARHVAAHRGEASFQSGLATRARDRRDEMTARLTAADPALAGQLRDTIAGLDSQITAAEDYARYVETGRLKLESSVAAFGAITGQLALALAGGQTLDTGAILQTIADQTGTLSRQVARIDQGRPPPPPPQ